MSENIKVVSFNIEFCASVTKGYWQYLEFFWKYLTPHKINAIYEVIDVIEDDVDISIITEMEGISRRTHHRDYMKMISDSTVLKNSIFYPVNRWWFDLGNRGNAIATRYDIVESKNIKLKTTLENRYVSVAKLKVGNSTISVITTQLSLGRKDRDNEFRQVVEIINGMSGPIIFAGDLNTQDGQELEALNKTRLKRIETTNTFPSWKPKRRIDYMFHSPEFVVVESYILDGLKVSDHLPVVAEFKLIDNSEKKITQNISKKIYGRKKKVVKKK
jgi:endonuclease/exonuclease/phosphatase family metal-dependent hydrolase